MGDVIEFKRFEWYGEYLRRLKDKCQLILSKAQPAAGVEPVLKELELERKRIKAGKYTTLRPHIALKAVQLLHTSYSGSGKKTRKR